MASMPATMTSLPRSSWIQSILPPEQYSVFSSPSTARLGNLVLAFLHTEDVVAVMLPLKAPVAEIGQKCVKAYSSTCLGNLQGAEVTTPPLSDPSVVVVVVLGVGVLGASVVVVVVVGFRRVACTGPPMSIGLPGGGGIKGAGVGGFTISSVMKPYYMCPKAPLVKRHLPAVYTSTSESSM